MFIDDRPLDDRDPCDGRGCIPALDDPALVSGSAGDWYPDDAIVFGVTEGDESVAFPKNVMQVHEMVNITIGGRRFGIPVLHALRVGAGLLHRRVRAAPSRSCCERLDC